MWGSRIFKEAETAEKRRIFRGTRRRIDRRRERINMLKSLIIEDVEKQYPNFFPMLRETSLDYEDKNISKQILGKKHNLFSDEKETDIDYYQKFKTIYHLRKYLINTTEKVDIRLVYLAMHHIIKYRGNFLYEGDFSENSNEITEKLEEIVEFLEDRYEITLKTNKEEILNILKQKNTSRANKKDNIISLFDFDKIDRTIITNVVNGILGYSTDINKIFGTNIEKSKISFATEIENEEEIKIELQEDANIYDCISSLYSWFILQDILKGKTYISEAMIDKYEKYQNDLEILKKVYKKYFKDEYTEMFRKEGKCNYVAYNGKSSGKRYKKCKPEEFFDQLKKKINTLPDECKYKDIILTQIEEHNFLSKINVTDNGAIPNQLHKKELEKIVENQSKYYKTLQENKDKILRLFEFRIPYYVGPLANNKDKKYSWAIRKTEEKVRPWNFEDIIDIDATAEQFIRRMTNKCTYLINEDVMPKQSILYSKYCVLNELNNIKIDNHRLGKNEKKDIVEKIFKNTKKVTEKTLRNYYKLNGHEIKTITGLTEQTNFNSNMASYIDMKNILGKVDESNIEQCEEIIYWVTIFEEKKILKRKLKQKYKELTDEQINKICKLKYTGWSRLSKKLIAGLKANDGDTIMDKLEKTNFNFMQIINEKSFGFDKKLEDLMPKTSEKIQYKDIEEIPTSPANKRAIWQSICIVREIEKIMKKQPQNIYIEFARAEDYEKKITDKRIKQLLLKYDEIENQIKDLKNYDKNVYKELKKHQNDKTLTEKMYLYCLQNGKCLYSGKKLDIENLSLYEVDHIIPRSYIKDDSLDNKALVLREENQRKTDSLLLKDDIINKQMEWWKSLLHNDMMTQSKYYKLIRRKMFETDDEREKFVKRQLVETRQITKYVTNLLKNEYKDTDIYSLRAELTHDFRDKYKIYKNRNINNYHHAQDAYIISVIGNILNNEWHGDKAEFKYGEYVKKYMKDNRDPKEKHGMIMGFIKNRVNIEQVKKCINYKDCFISRMLEEQTGQFYEQTIYSPNSNKSKLIALKNNRKVEKYGGYSGEKKAYLAIYEYINKKGQKEYELIGIPIKISYDIKNKKTDLETYIKETSLKDKEYSEFKIVRNKILINQEYLDENNENMRLCSDKEIRASKELIVSPKIQELVYIMNSEDKKITDEQKEKLQSEYVYMYEYLLEKIQKEYKIFNSIYIKLKENINKFKKLEEKDKKSTINGMIDLMATGQGNLKAMGLTDREGRKSGQSFKTDKLLKMTFIDKSVTGMYERKGKINGMENSNS